MVAPIAIGTNAMAQMQADTYSLLNRTGRLTVYSGQHTTRPKGCFAWSLMSETVR